MSSNIKVLISGACGKMGTAVITAVNAEQDLNIAGLVDLSDNLKDHAQMILDYPVTEDLLYSNLDEALQKVKPDVVVDFTNPSSVYVNTKLILEHNARPVIGTTGLSKDQLDEIKQLSESKKLGCLIAPNFAIGAILMMQFAQKASKYFNHSEIVELHHNKKLDAPSGTAIKTAELMEKKHDGFAVSNIVDKELVKGARGAVTEKNIHIHSIRLPGLVAHQEVYFAGAGQMLTIRHDSFDRTSFMPGVIISIRNVFTENKFVYGLENIL